MVKLTATRIERLLIAARRAHQEREEQGERIRSIIVELPALPGAVVGEDQLVLAGTGRQPSLYHRYQEPAE